MAQVFGLCPLDKQPEHVLWLYHDQPDNVVLQPPAPHNGEQGDAGNCFIPIFFLLHLCVGDKHLKYCSVK